MRIRLLIPAAALLLALALAPPAGASDVARTHVLVRFDENASHAERVAVVKATGTGSAADPLPGGTRELKIEDGDSVAQTLAQLRAQPGVASARPDYLIHAASSGFYPNDPGRGGLGDWRELQWNFAGTFGVRAPQAWAKMRSIHRDGGRGVIVAVVDSGVAYRDKGSFKRAPDLYKGRFVKGWDLLDHDRYPLDEDSHGTHVTGTIAEHVNNKQAVTGIAYGVRIMPVRVLDANGDGDGATFARAVRWATDHGADVINMSVEFNSKLRASDIPEVISALRYARKHGVTMVGSAGNEGARHVSYPARDANVISVAASTSGGCAAEYSSSGDGLDVIAPGGGFDAALSSSPWDLAHCDPAASRSAVYQQTFRSNPRDFHLIGFEGTSESAPHVTAIAALVIASGELGSHPSPAAVQKRIEDTARDIGPPGYDKRYGYGLVDAAAAVGG
jgi:serine protease